MAGEEGGRVQPDEALQEEADISSPWTFVKGCGKGQLQLMQSS